MEAIPQEDLEAAASIPDEQGLAAVADLVRLQTALEDAIETGEKMLAEKKRELRRVSEELLPAAMREHGLSEIRTDDGARVTVRQVVRASIPVARRAEAFRWLEANGFADLIKHKITASLGRGDDDLARQALLELANLGIEASDEPSVHHSTLSAFVREQTEQGVSVPDELLGVFRGEVTKIERP